jgi:predicted dehydrogenase
MSIRVGVVGLGFMGRTHLSIYAKNKRCNVVGVCEYDPSRAKSNGKVQGNVGDASALGIDLDKVIVFPSPEAMFASDEIDAVDLCLPTHAHAEFAIKALNAGKHVLCEKPLTIDLKDADRVVAAAKKARGIFMAAHCMRFWPEWVWLKEAIDSKRYGAVHSAVFRRFASTPKWTSKNWILTPKLSGSALFDLHLHDADFIRYVFGDPESVFSIGNTGKATKGGIDHVVTQYLYKKKNLLVSAEGGWNADPSFGFIMRFTVVFDRATVDFDVGRKGQELQLHKPGAKEPEVVKTSSASGWENEIAYFLECIENKKQPTIILAKDARDSVALIHAEQQSVRTRKLVKFKK